LPNGLIETEHGVPMASHAAYGRRPSVAGRKDIPGKIRMSFVMEQVLGHASWYENLRSAVTTLDEVDARWVTTKFFDEHGLVEQLTVIPEFIRGSARALLDVRRGLGHRPAQVLFFNTQKPAALCQLRMLRTPTILMTDVTPIQYDEMARPYGEESGANSAVRAAKHLANKINFRLAKLLLPWSSWTRQSLISDYAVAPEQIEIVPPGVDTDYWQPAEDRAPNGKVRLLFVGGNFDRKGGRLLFDVFESLGLADRAELHVVTRDPIQASAGIVIHPNQENNSETLLRLYQQSDIFVLPTFADCFSIASIEAMAVGLPVITTAVGGIPDIVEDGRTGALIDPGDGCALANAISSLVGDQSRRLTFGERSRQRVLSSFSAMQSARRIVDLARRVAVSESGG
jgi:glycosyltransferase involved in cell wall biosynthesis